MVTKWIAIAVGIALGIAVFPVMCRAELAKPPDFSYSYSLTIAKHSIVVTVKAGGEASLVVDGKMAKKDDRGNPRAAVGKFNMVILKSGSFGFWIGADGDIVDIDVVQKGKEFPLPKTAEKIRIGKKIVLREKSTAPNSSDAPPVIEYDFSYRLISGSLVYDLTQYQTSKTISKEFKQAVETFKPRRVKK